MLKQIMQAISKSPLPILFFKAFDKVLSMINTIMLAIINAGTLFTAKLHIIQNRSKNTITIAIYIHNADTVVVFISLIENSQINTAVVP